MFRIRNLRGTYTVNLLGIETSCSVCSVGFVNDGGLSFERNMIDPHIHSEKLLTLVEGVLRQAEMDLSSLDGIAVSIGPGSFTGLRIGLSTAKGLCFSLDRKLIAVSTFDAVAKVALESETNPETIVIAVDAKQGEFYFGSYASKKNDALSTMKVHTKRLEDLRWSEFSGDSTIWITDRPDVVRTHGIPLDNIYQYSTFCRGDAVARLAVEKYDKNEFADIASVEPMYLKDFIVKNATI
jgi:tRNA threonylcarbamoyladenosine biosynthesis protein TsaB